MRSLLFTCFGLLALGGYTQCTPPVLSISATNVSCYGFSNGAATVTASGTGPYTYSWSPSGQTTPSINNLAAGLYTVLVTDSMSSCSATSAISITQPPALILSITPDQTVCSGAWVTISLQPSGGVSPYTCTITNMTSIGGGGSFGSGGFNISQGYTTTTTFTANCFDSNGCQTPQQNVYVYVSTCTSYPQIENTAPFETEIFPNPASDLVHLKKLKTSADIRIINALGDDVTNRVLFNDNQWNVVNLQEGIYAVVLLERDRMICVKNLFIAR